MMSNAPTKQRVRLAGNEATKHSKLKRPRLAATMVLVRDQPTGYEVFMIERPAKGVFPRLHVFPGGKIDPNDSKLEQYCPLLSDSQASQMLCVKNQGLRFWVCAIRECFEECGVLLARRNEAILAIRTNTERLQLKEWAQRVSASSENFQLLLEEYQLTLATEEVHYFSHWITPELAPARFNTRFFLAKLPRKQQAEAHTAEIVSACWVRPEEALEKYKTNEWRMILPTLTTLRMISNYFDANDLTKHVRTGYHKIPVRAGKQLQGMQPFPE